MMEHNQFYCEARTKMIALKFSKTVTMFIDWWALPLKSLYLLGLIIFNFKILNEIFQTWLSLHFAIEKWIVHALIGLLLWNEERKPKNSKIKYKKTKNKTFFYYHYHYVFHYYCHYSHFIVITYNCIKCNMTDILFSLYIYVNIYIYILYIYITMYIYTLYI